MSSAALRQRILGAVVILSIGFIVYSILIQSGSGTYIDRSAQIPVQEQYIEPLAFEDPMGVAEPEPESADQVFSARQSVDDSVISDAPVLKEDGLPNAWAIQVGSFSTYERAINVRDQLIEASYKAFYKVTPSEQRGENLHRILVGPYIDAEEVAGHRTSIDELLGVNAILVEYTP